MPHPSISNDFVRVSDLCHYIPAPDGGKCKPNDPQLILIFSWMGAPLSQLLRYCAEYSTAYPAASQMLIQSDMVTVITESRKTNVHRQRPIVKMLSQFGLFNETPPRILLHVFSGGGSAQLLWLALAIEAEPSSKERMSTSHSPICLVLDSAPGTFQLSDLRRVLSLRLSGFGRLAGETLAFLLFHAVRISLAVSGRASPHDFVREGLNKPKILPWMDSTTPRLYLYSDADEVSRVDGVREHIAAARAKGLNVRVEEFVGSPHVQHSRADPDRYWAAVHAAWGQAVRSKL
ncbi:hypothetical protein C8J57DRAFT_1345354 [Mycena rebaudengoi]|nr:hypothetical protein C8J57DRAFT_1345354 [Mycena rebaudengoi]